MHFFAKLFQALRRNKAWLQYNVPEHTLHYYAQNRVTSIVNATDTTYPISDVRLRRSILIAMGSTGQKPHLALLRPWTLLGAWTLVGLLASLLGARTLLAAPGLTTGNNVCY